jgi:uncharacterized protein (TIGR03435 family)
MRLLLIVLMAITLANAQKLEFDAASIKPNTSDSDRAGYERPPDSGRFTATNNALEMLITTAYKLKNFQISGGPTWIKSAHYDVTAESPQTHVTPEQFRAMLRALLAERFKLVVHTETREVPVYALAPSKTGLKITAVTDVDCPKYESDKLPCGAFYVGPSGLGGRNVSMSFFTEALSNIVGRPVIDKTGFTGKFNVDLEYSPEGVTAFGPAGFTPQGLSAGGNSDNKPSIFTALQDKLGIKLESQKAPGEILVIDHAEKPTEN